MDKSPLQQRAGNHSGLLLVDINVLGIGSMRQYVYRDRTHRGLATGALHGIVEKLADLIAHHPGHIPIALWDDRCHWREALLPTYKRHRWETPEQQAFLQAYLRQVEVARELLVHLGISQVFCPGFEADDIADAIVRTADASRPIRLATTDADWIQALRPNVDWYSVSTGLVVTHETLGDPDKVAGGPFLSVDHFVQAKALAGDASDGIAGVDGVGVKTAAKIIREHGSVEALWARHDAGEPIKGVALSRVAGPDYRDTYRRNLLMIDWRLAPPLGPDISLDQGRLNLSEARLICDAWGLPDAGTRYGALSTVALNPVVGSIKERLGRQHTIGDQLDADPCVAQSLPPSSHL